MVDGCRVPCTVFESSRKIDLPLSRPRKSEKQQQQRRYSAEVFGVSWPLVDTRNKSGPDGGLRSLREENTATRR